MALPLAAAAAEVNEVRRVPIAPGLLDATTGTCDDRMARW